MDVNDMRVVMTVLSFAAFVAVMGWALSRRNKARFDDAAQVPFLEDQQRHSDE